MPINSLCIRVRVRVGCANMVMLQLHCFLFYQESFLQKKLLKTVIHELLPIESFYHIYSVSSFYFLLCILFSQSFGRDRRCEYLRSEYNSCSKAELDLLSDVIRDTIAF